jgi:hypothetical protein
VATTQGLVLDMSWESEMVCVFIGVSMGSTEIFTLQFRGSDTPFEIDEKRLLAKLLTTALTSRREVLIEHPDSGAVISRVEFPVEQISPTGPAIHDDLYAIAGAGIPPFPVFIVFEGGPVTVQPVLGYVARPHFVLAPRLPASLTPGVWQVSLWAPLAGGADGWRSTRVPVRVSSGPPLTARTLYPGRPAPRPYTIALAGNPALRVGEVGPQISADPIIADRADFTDTLTYTLTELLEKKESPLHADAFDVHVRLVSIFDPSQGPTPSNALVEGVAPNVLAPDQGRANDFVGRYWEEPDIVFCLSASTVYIRASARYTIDDRTLPTVGVTYDDIARTHGRHAEQGGCAAISFYDTRSLVPTHEFCHAASELVNGRITDLYEDVQPHELQGFVVNKKVRGQATDPVPEAFCTYHSFSGGGTFASDQTRDGLGYPAGWRSYHPQLINAERPNLMDATAANSELDRLTYHWLRDRLLVKMFR